MAKVEKKEKPTIPTTQFQVGNEKFKFTHPVFVVPGFNKNQPIEAKDALKDGKILAYLVKAGASVIESTGEVVPAKEEGGK